MCEYRLVVYVVGWQVADQTIDPLLDRLIHEPPADRLASFAASHGTVVSYKHSHSSAYTHHVITLTITSIKHTSPRYTTAIMLRHYNIHQTSS